MLASDAGSSGATPSLPSQPPRPASQQASQPPRPDSQQASQSRRAVTQQATAPFGVCVLGQTAAAQRLRSVTSPATGVATTAQGSSAVPAAMLGKLVSPPWGAERANQDNPDWNVLKQRKLEYRQILDDQYAKKADQLRRREEESSALDQSTAPSLSTATHKWGAPTHDKIVEAELAQELLHTWVKSKSKEKQIKLQEQMMQKAWMQESGRVRAQRFLDSKSRRREELSQLHGDWKQAAEERRRREEAERQAELDADRKAVKTATTGMRTPRRLRRPPVVISNVPQTAR